MVPSQGQSTEMQQSLQHMVLEVKKKLKTESKNELIRIVAALLLDNYTLKTQLADALQKSDANNPQTDESKKND